MLNLDGESFMTVSVDKRLGDKRHTLAFCCCMKIEIIVQDEDQNWRF
jgi:hypothetical protein